MANKPRTIRALLGNLPLGYTRKGGEITIDPEVAAFVQEFFKELLLSKNETQRDVFYRVVKSYSIQVGRSFSSRAIRNKFYIGLVESEGTIVPHPYPPILDPELFYAVQEKFPLKEKKTTETHKFSRFIRCDIKDCENYLVRELQKGIVYYRCHNRTHESNTITEKQITSDMQNALKILHQVNLFSREHGQLITFFDYITHLCRKADTWIEDPDTAIVRLLIELVFKEIKVINKRCTFSFNEPFLSISQGNFNSTTSFGLEEIQHIVHKLNEVTIVENECPEDSILRICKAPRSLEEIAAKLQLPEQEIKDLLFMMQLKKKIEDDGLGKYKTLI